MRNKNINEATHCYNYSFTSNVILAFNTCLFCGLHKATGGLGLYFSLECIAYTDVSTASSNVWMSGRETSKFVWVVRMFLTVSVLISQQFVKSGQIWDARPTTGQMGVLGDLWYFTGLEVKNRDCPGKSGTDGHLTQVKVSLPGHCWVPQPSIPSKKTTMVTSWYSNIAFSSWFKLLILYFIPIDSYPFSNVSYILN